MIINYLALICALVISFVAGWYSIIGLTAIFSASFWPVVIMGSVLEVGKVVTSSWLYRNWHVAPKLIRAYLTGAVIILMFITSMGIFGFLSRAHIEQTLSMNTGTVDNIAIIETRIQNEQSKIADIDKQIQQIDNALAKLTEKGQAKTALQQAERQRKTRDQLVSTKDAVVQKMSELKVEKVKLESEVKKIEAEVGPLKYIAALIYEDADTNTLEKAVRWVIILIVLVFDPLAILLLIAANIGLQNARNKVSSNAYTVVLDDEQDPNKIQIDKNSIFKI